MTSTCLPRPGRIGWTVPTRTSTRRISGWDLGLSGKVALVAASSKGLGRAVAFELAREGCDLIMCARTESTLSAAASEIRESAGRTVIDVAADLSTDAGVQKVVDAGVKQFGRIDILVTNVGGPPSGQFDALTREQWKEAVDQNLHSVLDLTRRVVPGMRERQWGRILNITSISAKQPVANLMLSNSMRAAVTGFARTLADEVATDGVTVNNILPGYTRTERVEQLADQVCGGEGGHSGSSASRLGSSNPHGPARDRGRVCRHGRLPGFRSSQLRYGSVNSGRWRLDAVALLER